MGSAKVDKSSGNFPSKEVPYHGMFDISINACLLRVHANLDREIDCPVTIKSDYPRVSDISNLRTASQGLGC